MTVCILTICICLTNRPLATSEKCVVYSTRPVAAGLTAPAAIHVGRTPGLDASKADDDSVAAGGTDDVTLSAAVAEFYTDKKHPDCSGAVKVFIYPLLNCLTRSLARPSTPLQCMLLRTV